MNKFISEKEFEAAKSSFISFPESICRFIKQNLKNVFSVAKLQTELKYKCFDKTAVIYKINNNLFISDTYDSAYWIYTNGVDFYLLWYNTNGGAVEDSEYIKGSDVDIIHYLILMGVLIANKQDYINWGKLQTAILREEKINEILYA